MSQHLIRVAIANSKSADQKMLDTIMTNAGFSRLLSARDSCIYRLPDGEYIKLGNYTSEEVLTMAENALADSNQNVAILVTTYIDQKWKGLERCERIRHNRNGVLVED